MVTLPASSSTFIAMLVVPIPTRTLHQEAQSGLGPREATSVRLAEQSGNTRYASSDVFWIKASHTMSRSMTNVSVRSFIHSSGTTRTL